MVVDLRASAHRGTLGTFRPAAAIISRITSFTPPPKVMTRLRLVWLSSHSSSSAVSGSAGLPCCADDLLGQPADVLNAFGAKHFRRRGVGDVDGLARRGDLPVEQLVDPPHRLDLTERALDVVVVERGDAVAARLGRPRVDPVVERREPCPPGPSITRSLLSWVVIRRQPAFSSPTSMSAGTRTSL